MPNVDTITFDPGPEALTSHVVLHNTFAALESCVHATIVTVVALTPTLVRVTFSGPVEDNPVLRGPSSYRLLPRTGGVRTPTVFAVTPQGITNPTFVDLTVDELRDGETYDLTIWEISPVS